MTPSNLPLSSPQEKAAWDWLTQHRTQGRPPSPEFLDWLAADPHHPSLYAQAEMLWGLTEKTASQLAQQDGPALAQYLKRMQQPRRNPMKQWAMAASFLLALSLGWVSHPDRWLENLRADQYTQVAEVRTLTLADGSTVTLDANSAIRVQLSDHQRQVELLRGAAWFRVQHDTQRPFTVTTPEGETQVLGTEFEVRHLSQETQVSLFSGRVSLKNQHNALMYLKPGQHISLHAHNGFGAIQGLSNPEKPSWVEGWLTFYQTPLRDILEQLANYHTGRILLLNDELGEQKVSGTFPAKAPEKTLAALQNILGFDQSSFLGNTIIIH